jgi:hypothetical protein
MIKGPSERKMTPASDTAADVETEWDEAVEEGRRLDHEPLPPVEPLVAYRPVSGHDVLGDIHVCRSCRSAMLSSESEFVRCLASSANFTHDLRQNELAFTPWDAYQAVSRSPVCISESPCPAASSVGPFPTALPQLACLTFGG